MNNNQKATKRALLTSVMALVMCVVMLVGTTFAWFTDTASTAVNKIQAGTLDVGLEMKDDSGDWVNAEGKTLGWVAADGRAQDQILWEPGCTYKLPTLKITNKGNLALQFKILVNNISGDMDLLNALEFTCTYADEAWAFEPVTIQGSDIANLPFELPGCPGVPSNAEEFGITGSMLPDSGYDDAYEVNVAYYTIEAHMKEEAGNEYQGKALENLSVTVVATQLAGFEKDSFDDLYDKDATYPVVVSNQQQANDAITNATNKQVNIALPSNQTVTLDNGIANAGDKSRDVTFSGNGTQTVDVITNAVSGEGGQLNYQRGSSFTFENLTIDAGRGDFDGIVCDELTFKDCTIKGKLTLYGKATFINCTFDNTMENQYSIWTWGGTDVKFENCTFNTNGKAILLYGSAPTNLVVNNCTFNDRNNGSAEKAAIEIGNDYNATYTLTVNNATVNGFGDGKNTGSKLWANKNSMDAAHLTVTIDGTQVQ